MEDSDVNPFDDHYALRFFEGFGAKRRQELPLYIPDSIRPFFSLAVYVHFKRYV